MASIAETLQLGMHYHKAGALQQAEQLYRHILQQAPTNADALHFLSVLCCQTSNFTAAIEYLRTALDSHPTDGRFYGTLGVAYQGLKHFDVAAEYFGRAVQLMPSSPEWHFNL